MKHVTLSARSVYLLGCAAVALAAAGSASAQAAPGASAAGQPAAGALAPGEIVVTAQRRAEALEKVPMSVAVVSSATIQKSGVQSIHDLNQLVVGASVSFAGCCSQPSIRGISTLTTGVGFENNIATYVDGFYVPDNISVNGDLANISSIEVLKGPQGALWGRNATGGAILINTLAPSRTWTGNFEAGYGKYDEVTTKAYLSGPINDRLRFSVAEASRISDGYNEQIGRSGNKQSDRLTPIKQITVRTKLEWEATDWLTATAAYNYADSADPRSNLFQYYANVAPQFCIFQCYNTSDLNRSTAPYTASPDMKPKAEAIMNEGTLKLVAQTPIGDLTSNTGYAHRHTLLYFDFDESFAPLFDSRQRYQQNTFQESLNYNINAIKHLDLTLGAEYLHDHQFLTSGTGTTSTGPLDDLDTFVYTDQLWDKYNTSYALYFDGNYHITDRLSLDVGARYSHDHTKVTAGEVGIVSTPFETAAKSFHAFTPRASLRYELAPRTDVYFTYSQGFRSGGFNPVPPLQTTPFQPEKIKSYEVGFKTSNRWIQFDSAFFYYDYTNLQVGVTLTSNGGTTVTDETLNAKAARVYGWDNNLVLHPFPHATLQAGIEWLHARYTDFANASGVGLCVVPTPSVGCTADLIGQNIAETQNLKGQRMIRAPDISGFVGGDYEFQNVGNGTLDAALNVTFQSKAPTESASLYGAADPAQANKERYVDPGRTLVNGSLTWKDSTGHYMVGAWIRNLTNKKYLIVNGGVAPFGDFRSFGEPRTFGGKIGYSF